MKTIQYASIPGVDPDFLSLDIYEITGPAAVVFDIHGGVWASGDKRNNVEFKKNLFRENGYVYVRTNYRLSTPESGVVHPTHVQDVATAIAWVHDNIGQYGGDSTKLALLGHSAGAHLGALVCTDEIYLQSLGLDLNIICGCASLDTQAYNIRRVISEGGNEVPSYTRAFGNDPTVWGNASPLSHLQAEKGIPPFILARRGSATRRQICDEFADSLTAAGINVTIINASTLSHMQVNEFPTEQDNIITSPLLAFLQFVFRKNFGSLL